MLLSAWNHPCGVVWLLAMACCTAVIFYTDIRFFWIPDVWAGIAAAANSGAVWMELVMPDWYAAGIGVVFMLALYLLYPGGMGSGDVKLAAALALGCPGLSMCMMLLAAFCIASVVGLVYWCACRRNMLPFGPFLLMGWWLAVAWGEEWLICLGW